MSWQRATIPAKNLASCFILDDDDAVRMAFDEDSILKCDDIRYWTDNSTSALMSCPCFNVEEDVKLWLQAAYKKINASRG